MGQMPFYAIFVTTIAGFFTAALTELGLGVLQIALTIGVFVVTFLSAFWIGNVIAALLRTKFGKKAERALGLDQGLEENSRRQHGPKY